MTVEGFFGDFASEVDLGLSDPERELIQTKQSALREKLNLIEDIQLVDDFLTGSYRRHTIIKPKYSDEKFDVDVFIAFSNDDYGEWDLEEMRGITIKSLRKVKSRYPELGITELNEKQARSVGAEFGGDFQIDIVPAIQIHKDKLYKIFDKRSCEAVRSNPKLHGQRLTEANERTASGTVHRLVPIIKILKAWKREKCDFVKSFHLEILAMEILGQATIGSYSKGIVRFFNTAGDYLQQACLRDPANPESLIDEYLDRDNTRRELLSLVAAEKLIVQSARKFEANRLEDAAVREWKKIFDTSEEKSNTPVAAPVVIKRNPPKLHAWKT